MRKGTDPKANSLQSFTNVLRNEDTENRLIYQALRSIKQPLTRRELSMRTGLEIATLCRALFNLIHRNRTLKVSHYAPCKHTRRTVMHFDIIRKEGKNEPQY